MNIEIENDYVKYVIGSDGQNLHFIDKRNGTDYCIQDPKSSFVRIKKAGQYFDASALSQTDNRLTVQFSESGISAVIKATAEKHYFVLEVLSINGEDVEELMFVNLQLTPETTEGPFAGCALALNLKTNVPELPRANTWLRAMCYPRFGFTGAKVAIIGCPQNELRGTMKEAVSGALELPYSSIGGPFALDAEINRGSYLFNFGNMSEDKVDDWIQLVHTLGINQIDFHGGNSFRFGDCKPNPETYPRGFDSFKAVIDKLHSAGIAAGLHTYAFFIDKRCPWVTPVPDPRLAKDATFTLAQSLSPEATTVPVIESTENMSTTTGFFVRNSVTLQIDNELITYKGISKEPPYAFTECQRGACGTQVASHPTGGKVHHLKECFGLFVPDADSTLLEEVAAKTTEMFNECGFDMMYLDALDGEDILGGGENGWHYGSKFVFELWKRLKKPALMEMSTFHHHLWYVRSRMGAWDSPSRGYKKFIDIHCSANEENKRMFLPENLGWWAVRTWSGIQSEATFSDDIEYLCCKCIATDSGLSLQGVDPYNIPQNPGLERLGGIIKRYEDLRHANYFPEHIKKRLRAPGEEFTLVQGTTGEWQFKPVQCVKHKVEGINGWSNIWKINNKYDRQPLQLRIEALMSAAPYDTPENVILADFSDPTDFPNKATESGVTATLQASSDRVKAGHLSGCYAASRIFSEQKREITRQLPGLDALKQSLPEQKPAWAKMGKVFTPPLDLSGHQALGVWIYGDGKGEVLNFQIRSPENLSEAIGEHYVIVDFTGWRYFELIEPESIRYDDYSWPYGWVYQIYFFHVDYKNIASLSLWYNNLPEDQTVECYLSPIKALPLKNVKLGNPAITVGGKTIAFPVEIESGYYLEFRSMSDCKLFGPKGELLCEVKPEGALPILESGDNQVEFTCEVPGDVSARANVTVISEGEPLD